MDPSPWFGDLRRCWRLYVALHEQATPKPRPYKMSLVAARAFADSLILAPDMQTARDYIIADAAGAESFLEIADDAMTDIEQNFARTICRTDGRHEPFLLLASMVLNQLDALEARFPEAFR
jgi:hypothetical protein